jgi:hypothetical protein
VLGVYYHAHSWLFDYNHWLMGKKWHLIIVLACISLTIAIILLCVC